MKISETINTSNAIRLCVGSLCVALLFSPPLSVYFSLDTLSENYSQLMLLLVSGILLLISLFFDVFPRKYKVIYLFISLVFFITFAYFVRQHPVELPRYAGSPAIIVYFVSVLVTIHHAFYAISSRLVIAPLILFLLLLTFRPLDYPVAVDSNSGPALEEQDNTLPDHDDDSCSKAKPHACTFKDWLNARPDLDVYRSSGKAYPVFMVSSAGGGVYAAANASLTLERLTNWCPTFPHHVFSIVGISGGAVGNEVWLSSLLENHSDAHGSEPCNLKNFRVSSDVFAQDHLSPAISGLIFGNIVNFFNPRAIYCAFKKSCTDLETKNSYSSIFGLKKSIVSSSKTNNLQTTVGNAWFSSPQFTPAPIFGLTNVESGLREVIQLPVVARQSETGEIAFNTPELSMELPLIDAALLSARFPFVTPSGALLASESRPLPLHNQNNEQIKYAKSHFEACFDGEGRRIAFDSVSHDYAGKDVIGINCQYYQYFVDGGIVDNSGIDITRNVRASLLYDHIDQNPVDVDFPPSCLKKYVDEHCVNSELEGKIFAEEENSPALCKHINVDIYILPSACRQHLWRSGAKLISLSHLVIDSQQSSIDAILAFVRTRPGRTLQQRILDNIDVCGDRDCHAYDSSVQKPKILFEFDNDELKLPLSWTMSKQGYTRLKNLEYEQAAIECGSFRKLKTGDRVKAFELLGCPYGEFLLMMLGAIEQDELVLIK